MPRLVAHHCEIRNEIPRAIDHTSAVPDRGDRRHERRVEREHRKDGDAREPTLHAETLCLPCLDIRRSHWKPEEAERRENPREIELAFECRNRIIVINPPLSRTFLVEVLGYHDHRRDEKKDEGERHVQEEWSVDLRLQRALDRHQRSEASADDLCGPVNHIVEDLRPARFEDPEHAKHLEVRHQNLLDCRAVLPFRRRERVVYVEVRHREDHTKADG